MNMYQPRSMVNFTKTGFLKTRAPPEVFRIIKEFWELNKNKAEIEWKRPTPYHNNWDIPPTILRVDNRFLPRAGSHLQAGKNNEAPFQVYLTSVASKSHIFDCLPQLSQTLPDMW